MKILPSLILSFILVGFWSCSDSGIDPPDLVVDDCGVTDGNNSSCVNYSTEIQPIFTNNCTNCHGGIYTYGNLKLRSYSELMSGDVVIENDSENSILIQKLGVDPPFYDRMPQNGPYLDAATILLIATWIDEGALDN